jgi:hypothetical protein
MLTTEGRDPQIIGWNGLASVFQLETDGGVVVGGLVFDIQHTHGSNPIGGPLLILRLMSGLQGKETVGFRSLASTDDADEWSRSVAPQTPPAGKIQKLSKHLTRSVRRASGSVQTGNPELISRRADLHHYFLFATPRPQTVHRDSMAR